MEWFTYIVYGLIPIVLFYGIGIIVLSIIIKLLIDSWARTRYKMSIVKDWKLAEEDPLKKRNW